MRTLLFLFALLLALPVSSLAAPLASPDAACDGQDLPPPYAALVEAGAAVADKQWARALEALDRAAELPKGPASRRRDLLRGQAQIELSDVSAGRTTLQALLDGPLGKAGYRPTPCDADPALARWFLAGAGVAAEETDAAVPLWEEIWTHNPTSPVSLDAFTALRSLRSGFATGETPEDRVLIEARAATLTGLQQHDEALRLLALVPLDGSDGMLRDRARATMRARDYPTAGQLFASLKQPTAADRFDRALVTSRTGDYASAATLYRELLQAQPDSKEAAEASFKLGYLAWDGGEPEQALRGFGEHRARFPKGKRDNEALWFEAWTLLRLGRLDEAEPAMLELAGRRSSLAAGGGYWAARIAGGRGAAEEETRRLASVLEQHPDTIYAWWAAAALDRRWEVPPTPAVPDPASLLASLPKDQARAFERGLALSRSGPSDWAAAELAPLVSVVKGDKGKALALAQALAEAGAWHKARRLAQPWCVEGREDPTAMRLCWPKPEGEAVEAAAAAAGLPPMLPFAIMHAESSFDARVVSHAGARGLMQLMPALVEVAPDELFDPATNTRLGVQELGGLRTSLADTGVTPLEPLIIAAYNGGEEAVRRWLTAAAAPVEVDRWSEEISFSETRRYVRRVLGALQTYRRVYGDR